jgi:hypothetical protein
LDAGALGDPAVGVGLWDIGFQNSFFATGPNVGCSGSAHSQCSETFDAVSAVIDWRFAAKWDTYVGVMFSQVNGGLANGYLQRNNVDPTAGLRFRF